MVRFIPAVVFIFCLFIESSDISMKSRHHLTVCPQSYSHISHSFPKSFKLGSSASSSSMSVGGTKYPITCDESVMSQKAHGTTATGVQSNLKWNCDPSTADRICCYNRHYAEHSGYWETTSFLTEVDKVGETNYYDSVTGKLLYMAPRGRTFEEFKAESKSHGWPSFRDSEVNWDNVRCLPNGECVSVDGTHLGHNLPDRKGNRYCINLVCVAGQPVV